MSAVLLPRPLCGIIPPLATPLRDEERLDHAGLERLVEHVLAGGVHGLFLLGSTGEGPSLAYDLRRELVERVCEQVAGRVPLLVGITDTSFVEARELAHWAADCGAAAVVAAPPCYFTPSQADLVSYFTQLAREIELPLFLYNMPAHVKVHIDLDALRQLIDVPAIVGLKDSSAQMIYFHRALQIAAARPDFTVLLGPEELLGEGVLLGAHGGICGGANLAPRLYVDLYEAAVRGDLATVRVLHQRVNRLSAALYTVGPANSAYLRGLKTALACLGLCDDYLAQPFRRFGPDERRLIEQRVAQLGLGEQAVLQESGVRGQESGDRNQESVKKLLTPDS
jgi:4-hydroxy-tetrahydrodipicolinate synthase